jgi:hypothetical protein
MRRTWEGDHDRLLTGALDVLRRDAETAAPDPSPALSEVFRGGLGTVGAPARAVPGSRRVTPRGVARVAFAKLASLGLVAQLGIGAAAAAGGVTVAAAADTLPTAAQDAVARTVELLSPLDLPDSGDVGRAVVAPGHTDETPGRNAEAPGHTGDTPGRNAEAPGHTGVLPDPAYEAPGRAAERAERAERSQGAGGGGTSDDGTPGRSGEAPGRSKDGPRPAGPAGRSDGHGR